MQFTENNHTDSQTDSNKSAKTNVLCQPGSVHPPNELLGSYHKLILFLVITTILLYLYRIINSSRPFLCPAALLVCLHLDSIRVYFGSGPLGATVAVGGEAVPAVPVPVLDIIDGASGSGWTLPPSITPLPLLHLNAGQRLGSGDSRRPLPAAAEEDDGDDDVGEAEGQ